MEVEQSTNNYHFKEINASPKNDLPSKLDQSIKQIIEKEGFITYDIDKRSISADGDNYLSTIYEIDVKGTTKEGEKEMNIFVKHTIDIGSFQVISIGHIYNTELFVYKELSKVFAELQENADVPLQERFKMVKVYEESNTEAIIMDNMSKKGYTTYYRMDTPPLEFVEKCIKHLARFHALSFVLKEKRPEYFDEKLRPLKHPMMFNDDWDEIIRKSRDAVLASIDEEYKDKLEKVYEVAAQIYAQSYLDESIHVCVCHGDYRPNNILAKIDEGELQHIMPVDYQLIHYGAPALDFLYFVFIATDREFRLTHMSSLKDLYYETLTGFLKYFGLEAELLYSRKEFEKVYKERFQFGPICGLLSIPFLYANKDHVIDMSKQKSDVSIKLNDRFKDRCRGLIKDFEKCGLI